LGGQVGGLMGELVRGVLWGPQLLFYLVFGDLGGQKNEISKLVNQT